MVTLLETQSEALVKTLEGLKSSGFDYLKNITAVDRGDHLDVLYFIYGTASRQDELLMVKLPSEGAELPTVTKLYPAADWYECELSEMFGIRLVGMGVRRLLLEECEGADAPMRKRSSWGRAPGVSGGYLGAKG